MKTKFFSVIFCIALTLQPIFLLGQDFSDEEVPTLEDEYYIGRAVAANILKIYKPYTGNTALTRYLNLICQTIVINSPKPAVFNGYHLMILDSPEYNAFATPGGHIFITKGLVEAAPSEDALAAVIAHELAHAVLKHGMKMIEEMKLDNEMDKMREHAEAAAPQRNEAPYILAFRNRISEYFDIMIKSGYSKPQEFEADNTAVTLLAAAGYDPTALLEMLQILQKVQPGQRGGFNNTHPSPNERIKNLTSVIPRYKVNNTRSSRISRFRTVMFTAP